MDSGMMMDVDWLDFQPRDYLKEYYAEIGPENLALLQFFVRSFRDMTGRERLLDFGCGPTLYSLAAAAGRVSEIHVCDYLESNLAEISRWLGGTADSWDWTEFVKVTLELEGDVRGAASRVGEREAMIRERVTRVLRCDASCLLPLGAESASYDVVMTNFCAESATDDSSQWRVMMRNITSLLKPGGRLVTAALDGAISYHVGEKLFPAVDIDQHELRRLLIEMGFSSQSIRIDYAPADRPERMYRGIMMASAAKDGAA